MKKSLYGDVSLDQAALIASAEEMPQGRASDIKSPGCCLKYATSVQEPLDMICFAHAFS